MFAKFTWMLVHVVLVYTSDSCMITSQFGYTLDYHYHSFHSTDYPTCLLTCLQNVPTCKSLSYDLVSQDCKLSNATRATKSFLFKAMPNSIYMGIVPEDVKVNLDMGGTESPQEGSKTQTYPVRDLSTTESLASLAMPSPAVFITTEKSHGYYCYSSVIQGRRTIHVTEKGVKEQQSSTQVFTTTAEQPSSPTISAMPSLVVLVTTEQPHLNSSRAFQERRTIHVTANAAKGQQTFPEIFTTNTVLSSSPTPSAMPSLAVFVTTEKLHGHSTSAFQERRTIQVTAAANDAKRQQTSPEMFTTTTEHPSPTTSRNTGFDVSTFCIGKRTGDYAYPNDCRKYITCESESRVHVRDCLLTVVAGICGSC